MQPLLTSGGGAAYLAELRATVEKAKASAQAARARQEAEERQRTAAAAARLQAARAAYTGDCYDCQDTGVVERVSTIAPGRSCPHCARGAAEAARRHSECVERLLTQAHITPRCAAFTLASYPAKETPAYGKLRDFLRDWDERQGLILKGPFGTGKTGLLAGALREVAGRYAASDHQRRALRFTTGADLLDALRRGYDDGTHAATLDEAKTVALLAIDDLGAEKPSEWVLERLFVIINARYEACLPTFITTNYGLEELAAERIGPRVLERLMETSRVIAVDGANLRLRTQATGGK